MQAGLLASEQASRGRLNSPPDNPELITLLKSATAQQGNTALSSLAKIVPEIQPANLRSVTANFIGNYLAYNRSYVVGAYVNVAWARIFYDPQNHVPCFEYIYRSYRHVLRQLSGYIIPTSRTLNFIGSLDNTRTISMAILRRPAPPEDKFDFLHGILLSVTTEIGSRGSRLA